MISKSRYIVTINRIKGVLKGRHPFAVSWNLIGICNRKCLYCYQTEENVYGLNEKDALKMVDVFALAGVKIVSFSGGEPLLRKDIEKLTKRVKKWGIYVTFNTNGDFLYEKKNVLNNVDEVHLSLDGSEIYQDKMRGADSFSNTIKAAGLAAKYNKPIVFNCAVLNQNEQELEFVIQVVKQFKAVVQFQPVEDKVKKVKKDDRAKISKAFVIIKGQYKKGAPIAQSVASLDYIIGLSRKYPLHCRTCRLTTFVGPMKNLTLCSQSLEKKINFDLTPQAFLLAYGNLKIPKICYQCPCIGLLEPNLALNGKFGSLFYLVKKYGSFF